MAKAEKKSDRIVVRLEAEMRGKLHERASALGLDDATFVRMLIYSEVNSGGYASGQSNGAVNAVPSGFGGSNPSLAHQDEPEPLPVEEMEIPADPDGDLDDLMTAGPSLLDEIAALTATPQRQLAPRQAPALRHRPNGTQFTARRFNNRNWGQAAMWGPGSMTRAVGVGGELVGNYQGDGTGNVMRDNFAHFGAVGTRSR